MMEILNESYFCEPCLCRTQLGRPSIQRIVADGSKIDEILLGKGIPLKERNLIRNLVTTKAVYNHIKYKLLLCSDVSLKLRNLRTDNNCNQRARTKRKKYSKKIKRINNFDSCTDVVSLQRKDERLRIQRAYCSCCSCNSSIMAYKAGTRYNKVRGKKIYKVDGTSRRRQKRYPRSIQHTKARAIQSMPCTCQFGRSLLNSTPCNDAHVKPSELRLVQLRQSHDHESHGRVSETLDKGVSTSHPSLENKVSIAITTESLPSYTKDKLICHSTEVHHCTSENRPITTNKLKHFFYRLMVKFKSIFKKTSTTIALIKKTDTLSQNSMPYYGDSETKTEPTTQEGNISRGNISKLGDTKSLQPQVSRNASSNIILNNANNTNKAFISEPEKTKNEPPRFCILKLNNDTRSIVLAAKESMPHCTAKTSPIVVKGHYKNQEKLNIGSATESNNVNLGPGPMDLKKYNLNFEVQSSPEHNSIKKPVSKTCKNNKISRIGIPQSLFKENHFLLIKNRNENLKTCYNPNILNAADLLSQSENSDCVAPQLNSLNCSANQCSDTTHFNFYNACDPVTPSFCDSNFFVNHSLKMSNQPQHDSSKTSLQTNSNANCTNAIQPISKNCFLSSQLEKEVTKPTPIVVYRNEVSRNVERAPMFLTSSVYASNSETEPTNPPMSDFSASNCDKRRLQRKHQTLIPTCISNNSKNDLNTAPFSDLSADSEHRAEQQHCFKVNDKPVNPKIITSKNVEHNMSAASGFQYQKPIYSIKTEEICRYSNKIKLKPEHTKNVCKALEYYPYECRNLIKNKAVKHYSQQKCDPYFSQFLPQGSKYLESKSPTIKSPRVEQATRSQSYIFSAEVLFFKNGTIVDKESDRNKTLCKMNKQDVTPYRRTVENRKSIKLEARELNRMNGISSGEFHNTKTQKCKLKDSTLELQTLFIQTKSAPRKCSKSLQKNTSQLNPKRQHQPIQSSQLSIKREQVNNAQQLQKEPICIFKSNIDCNGPATHELLHDMNTSHSIRLSSHVSLARKRDNLCETTRHANMKQIYKNSLGVASSTIQSQLTFTKIHRNKTQPSTTISKSKNSLWECNNKIQPHARSATNHSTVFFGIQLHYKNLPNRSNVVSVGAKTTIITPKPDMLQSCNLDTCSITEGLRKPSKNVTNNHNVKNTLNAVRTDSEYSFLNSSLKQERSKLFLKSCSSDIRKSFKLEMKNPDSRFPTSYYRDLNYCEGSTSMCEISLKRKEVQSVFHLRLSCQNLKHFQFKNNDFGMIINGTKTFSAAVLSKDNLSVDEAVCCNMNTQTNRKDYKPFPNQYFCALRVDTICKPGIKTNTTNSNVSLTRKKPNIANNILKCETGFCQKGKCDPRICIKKIYTKLKSSECEVGICAPNKCNPSECNKRKLYGKAKKISSSSSANEKLKNKAVKANTSVFKDKRIQKKKQDFKFGKSTDKRKMEVDLTSSSKAKKSQTKGSKKDQATALVTKGQDMQKSKYIVEEKRFNLSNRRFITGVSVTSSLSLDVKLYRGYLRTQKLPCPSTCIGSKPTAKIKQKQEDKSQNRKYVNQKSADNLTSNKKSGKIKKCFCLLGFGKKPKGKPNSAIASKEDKKSSKTIVKNPQKQKPKAFLSPLFPNFRAYSIMSRLSYDLELIKDGCGNKTAKKPPKISQSSDKALKPKELSSPKIKPSKPTKSLSQPSDKSKPKDLSSKIKPPKPTKPSKSSQPLKPKKPPKPTKIKRAASKESSIKRQLSKNFKSGGKSLANKEPSNKTQQSLPNKPCKDQSKDKRQMPSVEPKTKTNIKKEKKNKQVKDLKQSMQSSSCSSTSPSKIKSSRTTKKEKKNKQVKDLKQSLQSSSSSSTSPSKMKSSRTTKKEKKNKQVKDLKQSLQSSSCSSTSPSKIQSSRTTKKEKKNKQVKDLKQSLQSSSSSSTSPSKIKSSRTTAKIKRGPTRKQPKRKLSKSTELLKSKPEKKKEKMKIARPPKSKATPKSSLQSFNQTQIKSKQNSPCKSDSQTTLQYPKYSKNKEKDLSRKNKQVISPNSPKIKVAKKQVISPSNSKIKIAKKNTQTREAPQKSVQCLKCLGPQKSVQTTTKCLAPQKSVRTTKCLRKQCPISSTSTCKVLKRCHCTIQFRPFAQNKIVNFVTLSLNRRKCRPIFTKRHETVENVQRNTSAADGGRYSPRTDLFQNRKGKKKVSNFENNVNYLFSESFLREIDMRHGKFRHRFEKGKVVISSTATRAIYRKHLARNKQSKKMRSSYPSVSNIHNNSKLLVSCKENKVSSFHNSLHRQVKEKDGEIFQKPDLHHTSNVKKDCTKRSYIFAKLRATFIWIAKKITFSFVNKYSKNKKLQHQRKKDQKNDKTKRKITRKVDVLKTTKSDRPKGYNTVKRIDYLKSCKSGGHPQRNNRFEILKKSKRVKVSHPVESSSTYYSKHSRCRELRKTKYVHFQSGDT